MMLFVWYHIIMDDNRKIIEQIKIQMPIVDFLEQHGHKLIKSGANRWKMLCPFHDEKTPSCIVSEAYNSYHCFGCGASGDIFNYLEEKEGLDFPSAVESLANDLNIDYHPHGDAEGSTSRKTLKAIVALVYRAFKNQYKALSEDHPAKRNISRRNISTSNEDNHELFGWAGADDTLIVRALKAKGYTEEQIIETGIAKRDKNGTCRLLWRDRLMFVIKDLTGNPVGFTGRTVYEDTTDQRKYVNSSDSPIFHKSNIMFCEDIARKQASSDNEVFVVEGQFDVIAMQHIGKTNTVASSGTAFTEYHAGLLKRMVGENGQIVFAFDADAAGQKASLRTFKTSPSIQYMSFATITRDKDASDMYRDNPGSLKEQMEKRTPLYKHIINWIYSKHDMGDEMGRNGFINECMDAYETITDPILADNYITYMSLLSGIDVNTIRAKSSGKSIRKNTSEGKIILDRNDDLQPEDYMLALCFEQDHLIDRLKNVHMQGRYAMVQNMIMNHESIPDKIMDRLKIANEGMRAFELYSPLIDIDELFDAQALVIKIKNKKDNVIRYHQNNIESINDNTSPSNLNQYIDGMKQGMEE